jgi:hypothetical protein
VISYIDVIGRNPTDAAAHVVARLIPIRRESDSLGIPKSLAK